MAEKSTATLLPNLGLYYDRPAIVLEPQMLAEGLNFRVKNGRLENLNLGWDQFEDFTLNGPVTMITNFRIRGGTEQLIFGTPTDLYNWNGSALAFITPVYATGTVTVTGDGIDEALAPLGPTGPAPQLGFGHATSHAAPSIQTAPSSMR